MRFASSIEPRRTGENSELIDELWHNFQSAQPTFRVRGTDACGARRDLEESLRRLRTNYVDIIQLHNPERVPDPVNEESAYAYEQFAREHTTRVI